MSLLTSLSVLSSGMGLGYPAITTQALLKEEFPLTFDQVSWFASITAITCPIGGPLSGFCCDKFGRRPTILLMSAISALSWLMIGFSGPSSSEWHFTLLMIARAIIGIGVGMTTAPVVMYVSEVCHPSLRGRMTMLSSPFFTGSGLLTIYSLGYMIPVSFYKISLPSKCFQEKKSSKKENYRLVSLIAGAITASSMFVTFLLPESPVFLVTRNKLEDARSVLALIKNLRECFLSILLGNRFPIKIQFPDRDDDKIKKEIEKIQSSTRNNEKRSFFEAWKDFSKPELYKPFAVMVAFFAIQQCSGIFVIFTYAASFSVEAGVAIDEFLSAVVIGCIRCATTILVAFASDKFGRKPVAITSGLGMFVNMSGLVACAAFPPAGTDFAWLTAVFLYGFIFFGSLGFLTLPFAMVAEMYPQKSRGFAAGITMAIAFGIGFFNIKTFSAAFAFFGGFWMFSFYTAVTSLGVLFAIFVLPETKGKSLHEIESYFRGSKT